MIFLNDQCWDVYFRSYDPEYQDGLSYKRLKVKYHLTRLSVVSMFSARRAESSDTTLAGLKSMVLGAQLPNSIHIISQTL